MNQRRWLVTGALSAAVAVALGAFGAHALPGWLEGQEIAPERIAKRLDWLEVGVRYQMYHALALMVLGLLQRSNSNASVTWPGRCFVLGTVLFSGSLYAMSLADAGLHFLVPLGGLSFIVGWLTTARAAWTSHATG